MSWSTCAVTRALRGGALAAWSVILCHPVALFMPEFKVGCPYFVLQVRHTLPPAQCFDNTVLQSPGGRCGSRPNAVAVTTVIPLIEAGLPQCLSNNRDKARSCQWFLTLE